MNAQSLKAVSPFCTLLLFLFVDNSLAVGDALRTVAFSGDPAPGTPVGVIFSHNFSNPVINNAGQTAFSGNLQGVGVFSNDSGIWSEGGGSGLALVVREGDAAPGTPAGVNFSSFLDSPALNGIGHVAFPGRLIGPGVNVTNDDGIWSEWDGLALVAREGNTAPNTMSGSNFSSFNRLVFNDASQTAFFGFLAGTGVDLSNDEGIWSEGGGDGLALVARKGSAAPGTLAGVNFSFAGSINVGNPVLNDIGQTAFFGLLTGTGVDGTNSGGVWSEGSGSGLNLVAREGNAAPGTPTGVNFSFSDNFYSVSPVINNAGQTAFSGFLTGVGVDSSNNEGIWSEGDGGGLALVARSGNQAPGTESGVKFTSGLDFLGPVLNGAGQTAFFATLTGIGVDGTNNRGIWSEGGGGGLALVARSGNSAPGTPTGVNFSYIDGPVLNSVGQTAFVADLTGTGVDNSNRSGIWAENPQGVLTLIARTGDLLDIDDGPETDFRTISNIYFTTYTGNEDGRRSGFNDLGQLTFRVRFTDQSEGIFVSNLVAQPLGSADFDSDGDVDGSDFLAWQRGDTTLPLSAEDLALWESQFGMAASSLASTSATVPEPSTVFLSGFLIAILVGVTSRH